MSNAIQRSSTYPLSRLSAGIEPLDQVKALSEASQTLGAVTRAKLEVLARQIEHLQKEAHRVIADAERNIRLHEAKASFVKRAGQVYHLYRRGPTDEEDYFSILSPEEWGIVPHPYLGSYRLEKDMTWSRVDDLSQDIVVEEKF